MLLTLEGVQWDSAPVTYNGNAHFIDYLPCLFAHSTVSISCSHFPHQLLDSWKLSGESQMLRSQT